jgi:ribosome-binding ATPase
MRICIIGLPGCGKSTVFKALTGLDASSGGGDGQGSVARVIQVPDERVDKLSAIYRPRKTIHATIEYVDVGGASGMTKESKELGQKFLNAVRQSSALVHVVDGFLFPGELSHVQEAIDIVDTELVFSDLGQCEKRIERMQKEGNVKSGPRAEEVRLLEAAKKMLSEGRPLRTNQEIAQSEMLRGFTFLSSKTIITVINVAEDHPGFSPEKLPKNLVEARQGAHGMFVPLCAKLEAEIASLSPDEAKAFLADYGIASPARELLIRHSYGLLGLISFFTVGEDEVRAWTIKKGEMALDAAGTIHSDLARGFIAAEVVDCQTAFAMGSFEEAKKRGKMRLEGKTYPVLDGDIISIRFNV